MVPGPTKAAVTSSPGPKLQREGVWCLPIAIRGLLAGAGAGACADAQHRASHSSARESMHAVMAAATIAPMITEGRVAPTLLISVVLHESCLVGLRATLSSLRISLLAARKTARLQSAELRIVDNASSAAYRSQLTLLLEDLSADFAALGGTLNVSLSDRNRGFGAGHNLAVADAQSDFLLILNPDVELAEDALTAGIAFLLDSPKAVALNPKAWRPDGTREYLCKRYPSVFDLVLRGVAPALLRRIFGYRLARYQYEGEEISSPVELLSGACLLCRCDAFQSIAGFDEKYFMYFEDFDLSLRLRSYGDLCFLPAMNIVHTGGFAASKGSRHIRWFAKSALRFFSKHGWRVS